MAKSLHIVPFKFVMCSLLIVMGLCEFEFSCFTAFSFYCSYLCRQAEVKVVFPLKHFWNVDAVRREEDDEGRRGR